MVITVAVTVAVAVIVAVSVAVTVAVTVAAMGGGVVSGRGCELPVQAEVPKDAQEEDAEEAPQRCEDDGQIRQLRNILGGRELGLGKRYLLPLVRKGGGWTGLSITPLLTLAHHWPHHPQFPHL